MGVGGKIIKHPCDGQRGIIQQQSFPDHGISSEMAFGKTSADDKRIRCGQCTSIACQKIELEYLENTLIGKMKIQLADSPIGERHCPEEAGQSTDELDLLGVITFQKRRVRIRTECQFVRLPR